MKTAIIGGDKRMLYAAKAFYDSGADVAIAGFDDLQSLCDIRVMPVKDALDWADCSVLPIRPLADHCLNCPYSAEKYHIERFAVDNGAKPIFCGNAKSLSPYLHAPLYDYAAREDFAIKNAVLTAEGAIDLLFRCYEDSVYGAKILTLGYGRIGKVLARELSALGADVTVAARKLCDQIWIQNAGMKAIDYSFKELYNYSVIINTVPAKIINAAVIDTLRDDVFVIDLASKPGGVDFERARERDLTCVHALGLPGKIAPKAAGRIIKETIIHMIKEENGGKENSGLCDDRLLLHL